MKKELNPSRIYNKAAKLMEHNPTNLAVAGYSCLAIEVAIYCETGTYNDVGFELRDKYIELFFPPDELNPEKLSEGHAWGALWGETYEERNDCRVLALLFMSEIAKGG